MFITALSCYATVTVTSSLIRTTRNYFLRNMSSDLSFTINDKVWEPKSTVSIACANAIISPITEPIMLYAEIKNKDFKYEKTIEREF